MSWTSRLGGRAGTADFSDADGQLAETLDTLDGGTNYASWIAEWIAPSLGPEVLEIGAGHGTITEHLAQAGRRVVASDLSERCVGILADRFRGSPNVEVLQGSIEVAATKGPYDTAVLVNVLEHISDDGEALRQVNDLLKGGGRLVLWVPAFEFLYSEFDRKIGHHRRYRIGELESKLHEAGFEVPQIRYVNSVGAIGWLMIARILRRDPVGGGGALLFDRYVVPLLRTVERRWRPPFGQSIFVSAVKPVRTG